jgi:nicotinamidase-related amidase
MTLTVLDERAALVVVDVQQALGHSEPVQEIIDRSVALADGFRAAGLPVMLVRVTAGADGTEFALGRTDEPFGLGGRPPESEDIHEDLAGHSQHVIVTKHNPGAFVGTDLDQRLRRHGVTQVVVTGVATSLGVESTVRSAFDHDYHVVPVVDAMLDPDPVSHLHTVTRVFPRFGEVASTVDVLTKLQQRR